MVQLFRICRLARMWPRVLLLAAVHAGTAFAGVIYTELGDAGQTIAGAQSVTGQPAGTQLDAIRGVLGPGEADIFRIFLPGGQTFSATTAASSLAFNNFDMQLFLIESMGRGVYANDDEPFSPPQSTLPMGIAYTPAVADFYFLAISGTGYLPESTGGPIFPESGGLLDQSGGIANAVGPFGPGGALPLIDWSSTSNEAGEYEIRLTGAQFVGIPEPSSMLLVGLGLCLAAAARRRSEAAI